MSNLKKLAFIAALVAVSVGLWAAPSLVGLWKVIDDKSGKPTAIVYLYMYSGKMYGRILATISKDTGKVDDTIYSKSNKATKLAGDPPNCGLDFVYVMEDKGNNWYGKIIDPESGDEYNCNMWREGAKLKVRGELVWATFLGRDQVWLPASLSDLPSDFVMPDPASFKPAPPKKK